MTATAAPARAALLRGSMWLLSALAVNALAGAAFWLAAARLASQTQVGLATGLFTSAMLVNFATSMGVPFVMSRFGEDEAGRDALSWALVYTAAAAVVGSVAFVTLVSSRSLDVLESHGLLVAAGCLSVVVVGGSLALVTDARLAAARRWDLVLARAVVVGLVRFPLLALPTSDHGLGLFFAAVGPGVASGFVGAALLPRIVGGAHSLRRPAAAGRLIRYATVNYLSALISGSPTFVLPVIVMLHVSPRVNASFYVAWSVTTLVFLVPSTIGQVQLTEGWRVVDDRAHRRTALAISIALMGLAWAVSVPAGGLVASVYGSGYEDAGRLLPLLLAAGLPWAVTCVAVADARVRGAHRSVLLITGIHGVAVLGTALAVIPGAGLDGAARAWLAGNLVTAVVAAWSLRRRQPLAA